MLNFYQLVISTYGGIYNGSIQAGIYRIDACLISILPEIPKSQCFQGFVDFCRKDRCIVSYRKLV